MQHLKQWMTQEILLLQEQQIKNIDSITMSKATATLDAVADYYLTMDAAAMTSAISTLTDKTLLNYMLVKETRTSGKAAINARLGQL